MKTENLEALLIDRALGELPVATAELLDEYLVSNSEAARIAEQFLSTLSLAKDAIPAQDAVALRAFPRALIEHENRTGKHRRQMFQLLKLAACLAVGLSLGWFGKSRPDEVTVARVPVTAPLKQVVSTENKPSHLSAGFWSVARLEERLRDKESPGEPSRYRIQLLSPMMAQKMEGKL
jgi:anti-sigma factor RsiW